MMMKHIKRWSLLIVLIALLGLFIYFRLDQYVSFENLRAHRELLINWTEKNFFAVLVGFMLVYIIAVAISIPGAVFFTLTAGFLFGPTVGTISVVISATLGAFIVFLAVELAFREWIAKKAGRWLKAMEQGFHRDAFSYLLFLRLVPLFPFWIVNIVPALLGVSKRIFVIATLIGIIPASFVYVTVGNGLGHVFDTHKAPDLSIIFDPTILLPLIALACLSLVPIGYQYMKQKKTGKTS